MNRVQPQPDRTRRVAYVISSRGVGGAEKLVTALLSEGCHRGCDQIVLNPFAEPSTVPELAKEWSDAPLESYSCSSLWSLAGARAWLGRQLESFRADIVHAMLFHASVTLASLPRRGEKRLLTHAYGEGIARLTFPTARLHLDRWAGSRFDHVSAISESVKRHLKGNYGYPPPPVGKIVLGWQGTPLPRSTDLDRPPTIVCVAVLRPEKGHRTLIQAFDLVRREIPETRLVLVGGGPFRREVERMISGAGLENAVELTGRVPDIWPYLATADVFALASPMEALGIAVMEAMAAGLPVVVSNTGGLPEFVEEGVTGELFQPGAAGDLATKLTALLRDPARRERMSAAALKAAPALHMDRSVANYFKLYDGVLERGASSSTRKEA